MESPDSVFASQPVEYIDPICEDKNFMLSEGCTITADKGECLPVNYIVLNSEDDNYTDSLEIVSDIDPENLNSSSELNAKDKTSMVYTIHFPNDGKDTGNPIRPALQKDYTPEKKKSAVTVDDSLEPECIEVQPEISSLSTVTRLEDFMDVVTTYKCKFCRFSCPWKSGLMSHIRCCHITAKNWTQAHKESNDEASDENEDLDASNPDDPPSEKILDFEGSSEIVNENNEDKEVLNEPNTENDDAEENSDNDHEQPETSDQKYVDENVDNSSCKSPQSPSERHIFLCGQCSYEFESLEDCKMHMINEHNLKLELDEDVRVSELDEVRARPLKRGRPRTRPLKEEKHKRKRFKKDIKLQKPGRKRVFTDLVDEFDCSVNRKLRTGYVNDRAFKCAKPGCGHRFTSETNLQYHYLSHSSADRSFSCPECHTPMEHWRQIAAHLWKNHKIDVDLHACPDCDYKSFSFFKLDNHRKIHSDERAYVCEKCGKGFKQISQLRNHVITHMDRKNLPEKRWYSEQECDMCGRTFSDTKCLRKHQQAVHNKLKPYICSFCGHMSARKAMLELHMRQHTGEKPFVCEHCDYRTGDHNSLRRHRMRHTGDKPYKCPHCTYACIQAISYKTHLKNKHPGMDGLFSCTICSFKSVSRENYINHMSDHKRLNEDTGTSKEESAKQASSQEQSSAQMQLPDNTLQQLEGILPGNITAAQLIYSCINAMSQDGNIVNFPPGVTVNIPTTTDSLNGSQTFTIQLPSDQESENEPYFFTIQQQDGTTALLVPTSEQGGATIEDVQLTEQDINNTADSLNVLPDDGVKDQLQTGSTDLIITNISSLPDSANFDGMVTDT